MRDSQGSRVGTAGPTLPMAWLPAIFGLVVISVESTTLMRGANTGRWLMDLCDSIWGRADGSTVATANFVLRKVGHFSGYGILGLFFRRGWYASLRRRWMGTRSGLRGAAMTLAVLSTFLVASADEWHQGLLIGRVSSPYDVLLDTTGAILFNVVLLKILALRRARMVG
jgi:VanZ family protein